ncbi:MAG: erythromycin esterase family protein, partial [Planctomycetes bacterium]|nr:erythromycin esterase family protein [Planctomycetota bacterium]
EPPAVDAATWKVLRVGLGKLLATPLEPVSAAARAELRQALDTLRVGLAKPEVQRARDARMVEFWRQLAASLSGFAAYALAPRAERGPLQINPRDAQMGDNLVWLANQHYRGRKIIVWAATMHIARNLPSIDTEDEDLDYRGVKSMGQHAFAALGKELYALGFVAYQGRAGISWGKPWDLGRAPAGSLEDLCQRAGLDQAFLDFRGLPREHWLRGALSSRPLGHRPMVARWPDVIDGVVFQRVMTPSTMRVVEQGGAGDDARRSKRKRKDR